jgi:VanZ family protein
LAQDAPQRRQFARYWLPVVVYLVVIFVVSAQPGLKPPLKFSNSDKVAHILEYGGLGFLLARAFRTVPATASPLAAGLVALAIGAVIGASDEVFQATVPGRVSSSLDWLADVIGLALAQLAYLWAKQP